MGLAGTLRDRRVYFDTNIFIYLLEGSEPFVAALREVRDLIADQRITVVSCDLVHAEILPLHARRNDQQAIERIIGFLRFFEPLPVSPQIMIHAGILRGETGMRTPDAVHVASAIQGGCELFLTNDTGIRVPANMTRILLSDHAAITNP